MSHVSIPVQQPVIDAHSWFSSLSAPVALEHAARKVREGTYDVAVKNRLIVDLASSLLLHFTMPQLLSAYAQLHLAYHDRATRVALHRIMDVTPWCAPLRDTIVTLAQMDDEEAHVVATELLARSDVVPDALLAGSELGLLHKALYDAVVAPSRYSRTRYLQSRLDARSLTQTQRELGHTLSQGWVGTLDALEETVSVLRPA